MVSVSREIWTENNLQENAFKQCETLGTQNAEKAIFLHGRKVINRECVFRPLSSRNSLVSLTWDLQAWPEILTYRVGTVSLYFLSLANTLLDPLWLPMRKQFALALLSVLGAILWSHSWRDIPLQMSPHQGDVSCSLASEMPKGWVKLALSEVRKQQLDGFSSSC